MKPGALTVRQLKILLLFMAGQLVAGAVLVNVLVFYRDLAGVLKLIAIALLLAALGVAGMCLTRGFRGAEKWGKP